MGKDEAQMAYNEALKVKNETEYARTTLQDLFVRISNFLKANGATPDEIKTVSQAPPVWIEDFLCSHFYFQVIININILSLMLFLFLW